MHYLTTPTMASREGRKEGEIREREKLNRGKRAKEYGRDSFGETFHSCMQQ